MLHRNFGFGPAVALLGVALLTLTGCFSRGNSLPSTIIVELPDGTTVEVEQGDGVPSLADSSWDFFRTAAEAQGISFVTIVFGAEGNLQTFENNTIASQIFGSTILFDGERHDTSQAGFEYAATTFGAGMADGTGFSFEGRVTAFYAGLKVGEGEASATGTFDPDDPDVLTGTFYYTTEVTLPFPIEGADQEDEFPFIARRVVE
jgi:hypothetical protein